MLHPATVIDTTPRTLGAMADHNHAKAGAYEREARHMEIDLARQRAKSETLPDGMESVRKTNADGTWWRPGQPQANPSLVRADPRAKKAYLDKGTI